MGRGGMSEKISLGCSHLSSSFPPYVHPASQSASQPAARAHCQEEFWSIFLSDPEITLAEQVLEKLFSLELTAVHALTSGYHWNTCHHWVISSPETQLRGPSSRKSLLTEAPQHHTSAGFNACINQYGLGYAIIINTSSISVTSNYKTLLARAYGTQPWPTGWRRCPESFWLSPVDGALSLGLKNCQGRHCCYSFSCKWHVALLLTFHCKANHKITTVLRQREAESCHMPQRGATGNLRYAVRWPRMALFCALNVLCL